MATVQVNAQTGQAVGQFNNLTQAVNGSNTAISRLNQAGAQTQAGFSRLQTGIGNLSGAFTRLQSIVSTTFDIMTAIGGAVQFVFSAVLREIDKLQGFAAIMSVSSKSADAASTSYDFLRKTADRLGVQFDALSTNYAKLVAAIPQGTKQLEIAQSVFLGVANAARTMHATNQDTQLMFYAVTQIASKGVVSMEELRRQLGEKLPGVIQIAAKALNTVPEELEKAIRKGIVQSDKFLPIFGDALIRTFGDSAEIAATSVSASLNRLTNVWIDFSKAILDSGAGQSIVGIFDALREKLSDPYLIERFAALIKYLSERFTAFITGLTADDLRNGFDSMVRGIELIITVADKLIKMFTWIINNTGKVGAILGAASGAMAGATAGMVAGPVGMAYGAIVGGTIGAAAGGYAGSQLGSTSADIANRNAMDAAAKATAAKAAEEQSKILEQFIKPLLQQYKLSIDDVPRLADKDRLNQQTVKDLVSMLTDKRFTTAEQRQTGVREYARYGQIMNPPGATLQSVLGGNGQGKKDPRENSLESTYNRAFGLDANFSKEFANLLELQKRGKLNTDQMTEAMERLISKQPYMQEARKRELEQLKDLNKATSENITEILKQTEAKDAINEEITRATTLAGMTAQNQAIEQQIMQADQKMKQVGYIMGEQELEQLRKRYALLNDIQRISSVKQGIRDQTTDRFRRQIDQTRAMREMINDPSEGFTREDASSVLVNQNQDMFSGTTEQMEVFKNTMRDTYSLIESWRQADLISEQTAQQLKAKAAVTYAGQQMQFQRDFYGQLATLSSSSNKKIAAIGKAAAITQATIDGVLAVQKALAASPPPYNYAMAAAVGLTAAANVAKIAGFESGGYTGNVGTSTVAGVVHGREFVVNARATAQNREVLENMNRGIPMSNSGGGTSNVKVIINNNADGTRATSTEREGPQGKEIEVTIEKVVSKSILSGGSIGAAIETQYGLNRAQAATY